MIIGSDDPTDPTANPIGVCDPTRTGSFSIYRRSYNPDPDFNNLAPIT